MAKQKKETKAQLGKQYPRYRFYLNPYQDLRWTMCPQCKNKMHQRKLPLVIHVDPAYLLSLNKTCRYCPHCDLLIAHQNDVEGFLAAYFSRPDLEIVGNDYLVVGTMDRAIWKRGIQQPLTVQETLDALHDFKDVVTFQLTGGWVRDKTRPPTKK
ncbi:hypothetical protein KDH_48210 [Dictyobacter sp. S3.2.2.5]|uniref:Uncharacterized protein n=1 Tax=Dictyobacter halimunensis TaxID=3026934 RepID=A0ABQ6FYA2_9CHLR|nr:hypothetical protein KDH_48210 [Dictyobacter sp. S3.2.2.5]